MSGSSSTVMTWLPVMFPADFAGLHGGPILGARRPGRRWAHLRNLPGVSI